MLESILKADHTMSPKSKRLSELSVRIRRLNSFARIILRSPLSVCKIEWLQRPLFTIFLLA